MMHEERSSSAIRARAVFDAARLGLGASKLSHLGTQHDHNEDRCDVVRTTTGGVLALVCDGMGGMGRGDQASQLALEHLTQRLTAVGDPVADLQLAIESADRAVSTSFEADVTGRRPGTTCAAVLVERGVAYAVWVGDSSILLIRDGEVHARSKPHRMVQGLIDSGAMTRDEARHSPMARYLMQSLGGRDGNEPITAGRLRPTRLLAGDRVVLCSDGLTDFLDDDDIAGVVLQHPNPAQATRKLVDMALARGVDDNVTVVVLGCAEAETVALDTVVGDPWDETAEAEDGEPDYDSDILVRDASLPLHEPVEISPFKVAAAVFLAGVVLLVGVWLVL